VYTINKKPIESQVQRVGWGTKRVQKLVDYRKSFDLETKLEYGSTLVNIQRKVFHITTRTETCPDTKRQITN